MYNNNYYFQQFEASLTTQQLDNSMTKKFMCNFYVILMSPDKCLWFLIIIFVVIIIIIVIAIIIVIVIVLVIIIIINLSSPW